MKLDLEQIKKITFGCEKILEDKDGSVIFERMNEKTISNFVKSDWYKVGYGLRCKSTAGVCLDFYSNTKKLKLIFNNIKQSSSRNFYYIDILVNNNLFCHLGEEYFSKKNIDVSLKMPESDVRISIYLPNLFKVNLKTIEVDNGSYIKPVKKEKTILFLGDSITQGYDVKNSSDSYSNLIGRALNYEVKNLAVGGSFFDERYITNKYKADIIFVAYGTNDWAHKKLDDLKKDCQLFLKKISNFYKSERKILMLPLYRIDFGDDNKMGNDFYSVRNFIKKTAKENNFEVLDSIHFLLHQENVYSDKHLHPNDFGNFLIASNVISYLKK